MKLSVKFRLKDNVPFSIETLMGKQYRCGICGSVFYTRNELDVHIASEKGKKYDTLKFPELNKNISVNVIYVPNIRDVTNSEYPQLIKGDKFFDINTIFNNEQKKRRRNN